MNPKGRLKPETIELLRKVKDACAQGVDVAYELPLTSQLHSYRVGLPKTLAAKLGLEHLYFTISRHPQSRVWGGVLRVWGSKKPLLTELKVEPSPFEPIAASYTRLDSPTFEEVQEALASAESGVIIQDVRKLSTSQLDTLDAILQRDGIHIILK